MNITKEEVRKIASLSKLEFTEAELEKFTSQIEDIMNMSHQLSKIDTEGVKPTINVTDAVNVMREDVAEEPTPREELMKNVPDHEDGFIKVPAILDEGEDDE
ncbi:MAG TPA: Asp-tRNA(Asn)/Glu-tRNA(Gln) amidotransferase subunit GatC [Candidatus Ligilactobacillus excrementigallinarum]|uniref:Aspartyl/glutamyl-tRNA(Asn/Gln) amidotransferase subunit C n=1 Tax=Candidatus Ligilactobacillus excrementigallinarum TaxID=2838641 RepID=A0A9D2AAQ8_9LACO|nr:Asp-tRNA(Asn)/Glu-tRNA(Gln) amidotransferase subunit GatC [Candidatus Ligilactobacillus excrementigallinarum]